MYVGHGVGVLTKGQEKSNNIYHIKEIDTSSVALYEWKGVADVELRHPKGNKFAQTAHSLSLPLLEKDGKKRSKGSWLTLGPVIKKLFTDLEKETAYSIREAQCPSQIPLIISPISH